ncbi:MAG TPA: hypothetical protein VMF55_04410 [Solirubrobacterales bacterium]|nr:hypothetical protein [Solirubrobacterales bacterium]
MRSPFARTLVALALLALLASAALAHAEVVQSGRLRVEMLGQITPKTLPRDGAAPIAVEVGGRIETTDGSPPPQLQVLTVELNREGRIDSGGLPLCPYEALEPASTSRALAACGQALVGRGSFEAQIALPGQPSSTAEGTLLAFNGRRGGRPVLFAHIYSPHPFPTSFVIVFSIKRLAAGRFGYALTAHLPAALGRWGRLTAIELRLDRRYSSGGERHSYLSAGCPAPSGFGSANFPLARTSFGFPGGVTLRGTLTRVCHARGR